MWLFAESLLKMEFYVAMPSVMSQKAPIPQCRNSQVLVVLYETSLGRLLNRKQEAGISFFFFPAGGCKQLAKYSDFMFVRCLSERRADEPVQPGGQPVLPDAAGGGRKQHEGAPGRRQVSGASAKHLPQVSRRRRSVPWTFQTPVIQGQ